MKRIGLIGGTSWHSTIEYYRIINQTVNDHFGNNTNPPLLLANLNQADIHRLQIEDNWQGVANLIIDGAKRLESAGAQAIVLCANTAHKCYDIVSQAIDVPIIHIADATKHAIQKQGLKSVCFIGTKFSMEETFVTDRIGRDGVEVLVPSEKPPSKNFIGSSNKNSPLTGSSPPPSNLFPTPSTRWYNAVPKASCWGAPSFR